MGIKFPNPSRSFDENRKRVGFWGYDQTIEVGFYVEADALKKLSPGIDGTETSFLKAFDDAREKIYRAAKKAYSQNKNQHRDFYYILAADSF